MAKVVQKSIWIRSGNEPLDPGSLKMYSNSFMQSAQKSNKTETKETKFSNPKILLVLCYLKNTLNPNFLL